ncbi:MAG: deoxynucleoside kinase, partial [Ardenticatenaceae bacterium]
IVLPDLVIYLRATVDTLMERIAHRGRPYERSMQRDYIARLTEVYDHFFDTYTGGPLLTIDTDQLNVVTRADDLAFIQQLIRQALL